VILGGGEAGDGTGIGAGYYPVTLQVRIWDSTTGSTWETASIKALTASFAYTQRQTASGTFMVNQPGISVPEPGVVALLVFGVSGLIFLRRRG